MFQKSDSINIARGRPKTDVEKYYIGYKSCDSDTDHMRLITLESTNLEEQSDTK